MDQPTQEQMKKQDVTDYIRYYNNDRLHKSNNDMSPVNYELSKIKVSCLGWPEQGLVSLSSAINT